jgi:hypothetical protein
MESNGWFPTIAVLSIFLSLRAFVNPLPDSLIDLGPFIRYATADTECYGMGAWVAGLMPARMFR